jgi:hypothetical protein
MNSLTPPSLDIGICLGCVKCSKDICPSFGAAGTAMLIDDRLRELREAKSLSQGETTRSIVQ